MNQGLKTQNIEWQWPSLGASPSHDGLDSEIFDTEKFPHAHTFVREAIQNILDAKLNPNDPVTATFNFYEDELGVRKEWLEDLIEKKKHCGIRWPEEWNKNKIRWLTVQDENATGLLGNLQDRKSDFWGYWLNFGRSNKNGEGRGGRGIGRVTFLLASQIHSVLGITSRVGEVVPSCCGMSVLRSETWENEYRSGFAYLAKNEKQNVFDLLSTESAKMLTSAFKANKYEGKNSSGLSLVIPYPKPELDENIICAAAIENFSPAIANGSLKIKVGARLINDSTFKEVAESVKASFSNPSFKEDPSGILDIISHNFKTPDFEFDVMENNFIGNFKSTLEEKLSESIVEMFEEKSTLTLLFKIPVKRHGKLSTGKLKACIRRTPVGHTSADMFYREGMYLPDVACRNKADLDVFLLTDDDALGVYLNFCEGKAHLGLLENGEVIEKLREEGFEGKISLKRFVNTMPTKVRGLVQSDISEPDASVFAKWFARPVKSESIKKKKGSKKKKGERGGQPPPPPPPPRQKYFVVSQFSDGFIIKANSNAAENKWPINLTVRIAYADGRAKPKWSKYDFRVKNLNIDVSGVNKAETFESEKDKKAGFTFLACDSTFVAKITGFDSNRELIVHDTPYKESVDV